MVSITDLSADLILLHGRIHTMDAANQTVEAVAIKDGRVVATGADIKDIRVNMTLAGGRVVWQRER